MTTSQRSAVSRQLALVVGLFVAIVGCLLFLSSVELEIMSGVRAYVGGEAAWSKGQKDAAYHLLRYALSRDAREYEGYRRAIAVPLGDRAARRRLERPPGPRDDEARRGFLAGRNHPDDVPIMMQLFRRFRHVSYMAEAVAIWTRADADVARLERVAERLHAKILAGDPPTRLAPLLRKLDGLNARLTPVAESFSTTLGAGARALRTMLMRAALVATLALVGVGIAISWMILRRIRFADAALRASEERYRDLFDNASDLVYTHDLEGRLREVNAAASRVTGYSAAEAVGLDLGRIVAPEFVGLAREMIARKLAGAAPSVYELEILARDGRRVPLEVSTRLVYERGRPVAVHGVARDISDRKRIEAALAREAHTSAALARAGCEFISALDTPVVLERLCQLATHLLDCAAGETFLWDADAAVFVPVARVAGGVDDALLADAPGRAAVDVRFGDGDVAELVPGRLAMALRRGGEVVGIHVVRADDGTPITPERRQIAEGMAQVASLALANAHLVAELARASRLKSEFVSTMSHELRTPLNVILGYAEMARESTDAPARAECLRRVELAACDLLDLIESTLEVGRIDAGRDAVRLEPVALHEFLAQLGERCARLPRRPGVDFVWDDTVPACVVTTDPRKLTVVLRNLVGNALKFTERGSVRVDVAVETESIAIRVADTGIGIRAEDQASIFEIFRQGDGSDTRRFGGTGLGLYLVRRFVDQLGGRIELESEPGRGAAFTVTLPRATPAVVPRAA